MDRESLILSKIWSQVRGPFKQILCTSHTWERYDYNRAGCLGCGIQHLCSQDLQGSRCPLQTSDDGSICCEITGLSIPVVRYGKEFVPCCEIASTPTLFDNVEEFVSTTVNKILYSRCSQNACQQDVHRKISIFQTSLIRCLKNHKEKKTHSPACIPLLVANVLHLSKISPRTAPSKRIGEKCIPILAKCISDLMINSSKSRQWLTDFFIVGLLYLMRQGLVFAGKQWLPKIPSLQVCLPPENMLFKVFKISSKILCEVENEVKYILRTRVGSN